ncbi:MAG: hypothetical protein IPH85_12880 [Ignavibacteria bacterium]|nr:hypothetical protein [Ignavibacteria bacterium]MBK7186787.1 hypothetical protein [Ignavibacteria bacterium]MBL0323373.1 hypothetical protein [Ignavibacteria bacterium]
MREKVAKRSYGEFTLSERSQIVGEYLAGGIDKRTLWEKHSGHAVEHGQIIRMLREFGHVGSQINMTSTAAESREAGGLSMESSQELSSGASFELETLRKRVAELEKRLQEAEYKATAYSTMVDIAEKELKVTIRKKFDTKPSQR